MCGIEHIPKDTLLCYLIEATDEQLLEAGVEAIVSMNHDMAVDVEDSCQQTQGTQHGFFVDSMRIILHTPQYYFHHCWAWAILTKGYSRVQLSHIHGI